MARLKAKALQQGDTIGIIAPASPARSEDRIQQAVQYLERQGYRVEVAKHMMDGPGYLAAPDKDRLSDLHGMIRNKRVKAIMLIRGGYGTIRLLDKLDYELIKRNPKIFVGYSDATALFHGIRRMTGLASCFFGPMPGVDMWDVFDPFAEEVFWRSVTSSKPFGALPMSDEEGTVMRGKNQTVSGRMIGGNLTVFCSLLGTPYQPRFSGVIPFFEEIDEKPRKVDAYLAQLAHAGLWDKAEGILLGQFSGCEDTESPSQSIEEVMNDYFGKAEVPVVANLPWGHVPRQWTIPLGARMEVRTGKQREVSIVESVLE